MMIDAVTSRETVLAYAERLRRAAALLEAHAKRCTVDEAPAHTRAIAQARGMVRRLTSEEERYGHE